METPYKFLENRDSLSYQLVAILTPKCSYIESCTKLEIAITTQEELGRWSSFDDVLSFRRVKRSRD